MPHVPKPKRNTVARRKRFPKSCFCHDAATEHEVGKYGLAYAMWGNGLLRLIGSAECRISLATATGMAGH